MFKLRYAQRGIALGYRDHFAGIELGQLSLVFAGLARRIIELLLQRGELLLTVFFVTKEGQRLFEHLLQRFLLGFGQFALGNLVQAGLN
ncbi:hypothetical protein D3C79_851810 [compost metagenome]